MDADSKKTRRAWRREERYSSSSTMSSHKLEEIVQKLMKPLADHKQNFDLDLSLLLEEYLTEAGIHALDSGGEPNFPELALLLQQSAHIYSRKVDYLYQYVLDISDSLGKSVEENDTSNEQTQTSSRRKRKNSDCDNGPHFDPIDLEEATNITKEPELHKPPPTLPKTYIEFEPRAVTEKDVTLTDYKGESIGFVTDFHVNWNLKDGFLVDDLDSSAAVDRDTVRPVPLAELQQMLAARPLSPPRPSIDSRSSTPFSRELSPIPEPVSLEPVQKLPEIEQTPQVDSKLSRKRKLADEIQGKLAPSGIEVIAGNSIIPSFRMAMKKMKLGKWKEFQLPVDLIKSMIEQRKKKILKTRHWLLKKLPDSQLDCFDFDYVLEGCDKKPSNQKYKDIVYAFRMLAAPWKRDFRGFDICDNLEDVGGFRGWPSGAQTSEESTYDRLQGLVDKLSHRRKERNESLDDGFFEQSSSDSDSSQSLLAQTELPEDSWECMVGLAGSQQGGQEGDTFDVQAYAGRVLRRLGPQPSPFAAVGRRQPPQDQSRLLLATLFLANTGNVEILRGDPYSVGDFKLRLLSTNKDLYSKVDPFK